MKNTQANDYYPKIKLQQTGTTKLQQHPQHSERPVSKRDVM